MKIFTILTVMFFMLASNALALVVIFDTETKEIFTVGDFDDTVVPDGFEKIEIPGKMVNYEFIEHPTNMKFINKRFIVNTKRINEKYQAGLDRIERAEENALILKEMRKQAIDKLKLEGKKFKHVTE